MDKLTIGGKEYVIKPTLRAYFIFERITKKSFVIETLLDNYIFLYSIILANNKDSILDWDDFIDAVDEDKNLMEQFNRIMLANQKLDNMISEAEDGKKK